jgi:hypothetical protein
VTSTGPKKTHVVAPHGRRLIQTVAATEIWTAIVAKKWLIGRRVTVTKCYNYKYLGGFGCGNNAEDECGCVCGCNKDLCEDCAHESDDDPDVLLCSHCWNHQPGH